MIEHPMYSERLLDYFRNPRHAGSLPAPAQVVKVENPVCGDILQLSVLWNGESAECASFKTRGCTASIAAGSALAEWIIGKTREQIAAFQPGVIEEALDGLPAESRHAAVLCADAVRALLRPR